MKPAYLTTRIREVEMFVHPQMYLKKPGALIPESKVLELVSDCYG